MRSSLLCLLVVLGLSASASAQSFRSGVQFQAIDSYGNLTLNCTDPSIGTQTIRCQQRSLSPEQYDYFVGPAGIAADTVTLSTAASMAPQTVTKSSDYENGASTDAFNLWVSSLFQKPLLKSGDNLLHYTLSNNGSVVNSGAFHVYVIPGAPKLCTAVTVNNPSSSDCENPYSDCQRYFQQATCN